MSNNNKLTKEQIYNIPAMLKAQSRLSVANTLGVTKRTVDYWRKQLKKQGLETPLKTGRPSKLINTTNDKTITQI